jgi:hypothetical protein
MSRPSIPWWASRATPRCGGDHLGRAVDADHVDPERRQPFGERPVAAPEIENPLASARRQQLEQQVPEVGDEARAGNVALWVPVLAGHPCTPIDHPTHDTGRAVIATTVIRRRLRRISLKYNTNFSHYGYRH